MKPVPIIKNFIREQFGRRDDEDGERAVELLETLAELGRKMTPADCRAWQKSFALGAAKTPEDRDRDWQNVGISVMDAYELVGGDEYDPAYQDLDVDNRGRLLDFIRSVVRAAIQSGTSFLL